MTFVELGAEALAAMLDAGAADALGLATTTVELEPASGSGASPKRTEGRDEEDPVVD